MQARDVQKVDNAIHRINHYPADRVVCLVNTYPLDSDLSGVKRYPAFEQPRPLHNLCASFRIVIVKYVFDKPPTLDCQRQK